MKVTIVGGGVAALEALIALRHLSDERLDIELVTPKPYFVYRPLAVAEPFDLGEATRFDIVQIARHHGVPMHLAGLQAVLPDEQLLMTWDGRTLAYDTLLLAIGARTEIAVPGAITVKAQGYTGRFRTLLRELEDRVVHRLVFAVPAGASWPLPLYELALMTAAHVRRLGLRGIEMSIVTPEEEPLEAFGGRGSAALKDLLEERGIGLHTSRAPKEARNGVLSVAPGDDLPAERVVSLPRVRGPFLPGLQHDPEGFIPVDLHQLVEGQSDVYAAGDATTCPVKQGGVAAQQADAAAESIAARAGAAIDPQPFRPVLRGLLLTGERPRYMRAEVSEGQGDHGEVSEHSLWWPPSKIAGRYLAPYLALHHGHLEQKPEGMAVELDLQAPAVKRRAIIAACQGGGAALLE
jgi:sulfide:quinone oxidoreductase